MSRLRFFLLPLILISALAFFQSGCRGTASANKNDRNPADGNLTVVFLNDTHSHLYPYKDQRTGTEYGGAARWASIISGIRREAGEVLFLHAGDMLTGSDGNYMVNNRPDWNRLPTYGYRGLVDVPLFSMLGLDALEFGNHEFDFGFYWNYRLFSNASFDVLAANISPGTVSASRMAPHYKPYKIYTKGNFRVGVIGVITNEFIQSVQIKVSDPVEAVSLLAKEIGNECDVLVVLSHLGFEQDISLASRVSGIDVIVGGHTHTLLREPRIVNGTIITQSRSFGEFIGRLDLEYQGGSLNNFSYKLIPTDFSVPEDPDVKAWLDRQRFPLALEHALDADGQGNSLGAFFAGVVQKKYSCDAVLVKTGTFLNGLPSGRVSAEDLCNCLWPFRARSRGPEKDLSPEQVMDILSGNPGSSALALVENAGRSGALIGADVSGGILERIEEMSKSRAETGGSLFIARFNTKAPGELYKLVMDLSSWIDLYREGILSGGMEFQNYEKEIMEVLLEDSLARL